MLDTASQPREIKHCTSPSMSLIAGGWRGDAVNGSMNQQHVQCAGIVEKAKQGLLMG